VPERAGRGDVAGTVDELDVFEAVQVAGLDDAVGPGLDLIERVPVPVQAYGGAVVVDLDPAIVPADPGGTRRRPRERP
jgi:hypothetical protein